MVRRETVADTSLNAFQPSFGARMENALAAGWAGFQQLLVLLAPLRVFLLSGILLWIIYKKMWYRRMALK